MATGGVLSDEQRQEISDVQSILTLVQSVYGVVGLVQGSLGGSARGTGKAAARGEIARQERLSGFAGRSSLRQFQIEQARVAFGESNPGELGFLVETPVMSLPPSLAKKQAHREARLTRLQGQKQTRPVRQAEKQIQARIEAGRNRAIPFNDIRVATTTGANAGYWRERGAPPPSWLMERH